MKTAQIQNPVGQYCIADGRLCRIENVTNNLAALRPVGTRAIGGRFLGEYQMLHTLPAPLRAFLAAENLLHQIDDWLRNLRYR